MDSICLFCFKLISIFFIRRNFSFEVKILDESISLKFYAKIECNSSSLCHQFFKCNQMKILKRSPLKHMQSNKNKAILHFGKPQMPCPTRHRFLLLSDLMSSLTKMIHLPLLAIAVVGISQILFNYSLWLCKSATSLAILVSRLS